MTGQCLVLVLSINKVECSSLLTSQAQTDPNYYNFGGTVCSETNSLHSMVDTWANCLVVYDVQWLTKYAAKQT